MPMVIDMFGAVILASFLLVIRDAMPLVGGVFGGVGEDSHLNGKTNRLRPNWQDSPGERDHTKR